MSPDVADTFGRLAQLGEHLPYKQGVIGSSPIVPTKKNKRTDNAVLCIVWPGSSVG
jgi:hypothetical protein